MPRRLRTSTKAHLAGAVAAAAYVMVWWWWLPDISPQDADEKYTFGWILLWRLAGMAMSYLAAWVAVIAIRRVTGPQRRERDD